MTKFKLLSFLLLLLLVAPINAATVNVISEIVSPTKDSYVKFSTTDVVNHGSETTFIVKYNGTEFDANSRQGLIEYDFTPYLNDLSRITSLQFCIRVSGTYTPTITNSINVEPTNLTLNIQKMSGFTFTEAQTNDVVSTAYQNSGVTAQLIGSTTFPTDKNYFDQEYAITIDVQKTLASVTAQNPKVVFSIKCTASKAMSSPINFATKENTDPSLRPYMRVGLNAINPYNVNTISNPSLDTFFQNDATITTPNGTAVLDLLKGGAGTTMRTALIQFDFSTYSTQLASARAINLGLNIDLNGSNDGIPNSLFNIYCAYGITLTEAMLNNSVLSAYNAKTGETFLGTVAIPTSTTTATDFKFELNRTQLLAAIAVNPVVTFVVKSVQAIGGTFEFATKENGTRAHPYIQLIAEQNTSATDYFRSKISGSWNWLGTYSNQTGTWQSSSDNSNWIQATLAPTSSANATLIQNGHLVTADANATVSVLTVKAGGQLTLNSGYSLHVTSFTLESTVAGNGTFVDKNVSGGLTVSGTTVVQEYLTAGRNWYISSPVSAAPAGIITGTTGNALYSYNEPTALWSTNPTSDASFGVAKGYVANVVSNGPITFTGGALNNGPISSPTLTSSGFTHTGFNLVGNPYPSYLNWLSVLASTSTTTTLEPTMWYRTKSSTAYVFDTFNATPNIGTNNNGYGAVTGLIPPIQAFWVRVSAGNTGILGFDNTMRSHQDQSVATNRLKIPAVANAVQQVLRLQVSNDVNSDEAIVLFNPNASNAYDAYDSPKMSNNNAMIPEIYTTIGNEELVINGMNSVTPNTEIPVGFTTGQSNTFSIKATEFSNFDSTTKVYLKDNFLSTEQDLTDGTAYTFDSDIASTTNRFSLVFKSVGVTTGVQAGSGDHPVLIYKNTNNQILAICNGSISDDAYVSVYNALGQKLEQKKITGITTVIDRNFYSGVYVVTVNNGGTSTSKKVLLN